MKELEENEIEYMDKNILFLWLWFKVLELPICRLGCLPVNGLRLDEKLTHEWFYGSVNVNIFWC